MRGLLGVCFVLGALSAGCGGPSGVDTVHLTTEVHVVHGAERERLGTGAEEARVRAAASALESALGHAVAIEVDAALTPPSRAAVVEQTGASLEGLARYFTAEGKDDPLLHAFVRQKLQRIAARYRAAAEEPEVAFDASAGTLVFSVRQATSEGWLAGRFSLENALAEAYREDLAARFEKSSERSLGNEDLAPYFRYLTTRRGDRSKSEPSKDHADRIAGLLRLEVRARETTLHGDVERALTDQSSWLLDGKQQGAELAGVRTSYAKWIDDRLFVMAARSRSTLYEALFRRSECANDPCPFLPEVDRTRLALSFLERAAPPDEQEFGAFDQAVCLHEEKNGKLERSRSCANVYEFLTASDPRSERLVAVLVRTKRRELLVSALANARSHTARLLAALERKGGGLYAEALRIMLDLDDYRFRDQRSTLRDEVTRLWARRPDLRPIFLRVVVEDYAHSGRDDEAIAKLANEYAPLDAALFARFLDEGPRAVELAPTLWPALKNVATPFEIVAPRLDAYVAKRGLDAAKTVASLVRRACQTRDVEGLRVIRVVLQKRVQNGDKDAVALALAARDCKAPTSDGAP